MLLLLLLFEYILYNSIEFYIYPLISTGYLNKTPSLVINEFKLSVAEISLFT